MRMRSKNLAEPKQIQCHYNTHPWGLQGKWRRNGEKSPTQQKCCAGQRGTKLEVVELLSCAGKLFTVIGMSQVDEHLSALTYGGTTEIGNAVLGNNILDVVTLMGNNSTGSQGSLDLGHALLGTGLEAKDALAVLCKVGAQSEAEAAAGYLTCDKPD